MGRWNQVGRRLLQSSILWNAAMPHHSGGKSLSSTHFKTSNENGKKADTKDIFKSKLSQYIIKISFNNIFKMHFLGSSCILLYSITHFQMAPCSVTHQGREWLAGTDKTNQGMARLHTCELRGWDVAEDRGLWRNVPTEMRNREEQWREQDWNYMKTGKEKEGKKD